MPKYRTDTGVVVELAEEKAARVGGLTPVEEPQKKAAPKKTTHSTK